MTEAPAQAARIAELVEALRKIVDATDDLRLVNRLAEIERIARSALASFDQAGREA